MIKQECTCTDEVITNPRKAIENRKALQELHDTSLKTCPLKHHNRRRPVRAHFEMTRLLDPTPPPSNNNECSKPISATPKFVTPANSECPSPPPQKSSPKTSEKAETCSPKTPKKPEACANSPESVCAKLKAERMRRFAIGFAIGSLLLLLLYWNFRKTILNTLGLSDGSEDDDLDGMAGDGSNAMSLYQRNLLNKRRQICWFNLPCMYDYEEDDWVVSEVEGPKLRRHDKLHL